MTRPIGRRAMLRAIGGGACLTVACSLAWPPRKASAAPGDRLNAMISVAGDGTVTVSAPPTEMGQGVHTLLVGLVAEELEIDPADARVQAAPVAPAFENRYYGTMVTGGSTSAIAWFEPFRIAGAAARHMLVAAAAERWGIDPTGCEAAAGRIRNRTSGDILPYGVLAAAASRLQPPTEVGLKPRSAWRVLGRPMRRHEGPQKLAGSAVFGIDLQVPGMLVGTIRHSPVIGGNLRSVDPGPAVRRVPSAQVVPLEDAVAVLAPSFWEASRALEALQPDWDPGPNAGLDSAAIGASLDAALGRRGALVAEHGDAAQADAEILKRLDLRFEVPLLAHAPLEPLSATVSIGPDGVDAWAPTQSQTAARDAIAARLGVPPAAVRIHTTLAGGSFGRNLQVAHMVETALTARAAGRPVKLIWSREEDLRHDFYRPPAATAITIGLDRDGRPVSWQQRLAVPDLRRAPAEIPADPPASVDPTAVEGAAPFPYAVSHHRLTWHDAGIPVPMGWWRSVGHSYNAWFVEHAFDIAARASGRDPVALRLAMLANRPRHAAVLRADRDLWPQPPAAGRFRGTALHASFGSIVAQSVEISMQGDRPVLHRATCAIDCGMALDPDTTRAQMEGGMIFGLSAALYGEITVRNGRVQQQNFDQYRLLSLRDTPEIDVTIVDSGADLGGVGEAGVPPIAPALCNAILAATDRPTFRLPIHRRNG